MGTFAQECSSNVQEFKKSFEQIKLACPQDNLEYQYIIEAEPKRSKFIPTCIYLGELCITTCEQFESKSESCYKSKTKSILNGKNTDGLQKSSSALIEANNKAIACLEGTFSDCSSALYNTYGPCMAAHEGAFRTNENCDVTLTNIAIQVRRLGCETNSADDMTKFEADKSNLLEEVMSYATKTGSLGRKIEQQIKSNKLACEKVHEAQVAKKRATIRELLNATSDAHEMKRAVGSQ